MAARFADAHPFRTVAGKRKPVGKRRFFVWRFHAGQVERFLLVLRCHWRGFGHWRRGGAVGPDRRGRAWQWGRAQGVPHFLLQSGAHLAVRQFLPIDHAKHEIDRLVIGREGHQDAAIQDVRPTLVDEFGFESDRRGIGDDLEIMVGQPGDERAGGDIVDIGDRPLNLAFLPQRGAEIDHRGIIEAHAEIEQDAVRAKILQLVRRQILDRRQGAIA